MTCGIYILKFTGTHKVYVGQSKNIERRYLQHITSLNSCTAAPKLQKAFEEYGKPRYEIITEAPANALDSLEDEAISIWGSVVDGFNTYASATEAPTNTGYGGGNTKYSKEIIVSVFLSLTETDKTFETISTETLVNVATVSSIAALYSHRWLKEDYPEAYSVLEAKKYTVRKSASNLTVSDKLSAKSRGIKYPNIVSPDGVIYVVDNAYKFAKERGLAPNHFQEVLNGHRKTHKGWRVCLKEAQ